MTLKVTLAILNLSKFHTSENVVASHRGSSGLLSISRCHVTVLSVLPLRTSRRGEWSMFKLKPVESVGCNSSVAPLNDCLRLSGRRQISLAGDPFVR